jgi:hypothetical protein
MSADSGPFRRATRQAGGPRAKGTRMAASKPEDGQTPSRMNSRTASATSWTAIAVSSKLEIRVTSSMLGCSSTRLTTPANRSASHSTTSTLARARPRPARAPCSPRAGTP